MSRADTSSDQPVTRPPLPNPRRLGTFGMILFLASLSMLFAAAMFGYIMIRLQVTNPDRGPTPPLGDIHLPLLLWLSTFIIVVSSAVLHYAGMSVALERQRAFRNAVAAVCALGFAFLVVQTPALYQLLSEQHHVADVNNRLYVLIITLVGLHAAHVIGGLVPLVIITVKSRRGTYDHEHHHPVTHFAMYWHFLDVIWVLMFSILQILR
jgi:cytochrome c oxidase subunit III